MRNARLVMLLTICREELILISRLISKLNLRHILLERELQLVIILLINVGGNV